MTTGASSTEPPVPFAAVLALETRHARRGLIIGMTGALLAHSAPAIRELTILRELATFADQVRNNVQARIRFSLDIDVEPPEPEPPPPEPPPPEPEPEPEVPTPKAAPAETAAAPPPAAAEAGKVLTAEPDPNEPVDLTGDGWVQGTGETYVGGVTSSSGTSKSAVYDPRATGAAAPPVVAKATAPAATKVNLTRKATPAGGSWDDCGFPAEADMEQVHNARVSISVTVDANGTARSVTILKDPGYGFGTLARSCALRKRYSPALDAEGNATTATTPPFTIRFTR